MSVFALASAFNSTLIWARVVVYFDAVFEVWCAAALVWLVVVGVKERRGYLELTRRIQLEDTSTASI